jgi:hypothetical protein
MKKLIICFLVGAVVMFMLSSCAASKRDCQGNKHYKQKGGFYLWRTIGIKKIIDPLSQEDFFYLMNKDFKYIGIQSLPPRREF